MNWQTKPPDKLCSSEYETADCLIIVKHTILMARYHHKFKEFNVGDEWYCNQDVKTWCRIVPPEGF